MTYYWKYKLIIEYVKTKVSDITKYIPCIFFVEDTEPKFAYGLLQQFTEVHVLNAPTSATIKHVDINENDTTRMRNPLATVFPYLSRRKDRCDSKDNAANYALLQSFRKKCVPRVFRVYPLPSFQFFDPSNPYDMILLCPYHILIPRSHVPKDARSTNDVIMCKFCIFINNRT